MQRFTILSAATILASAAALVNGAILIGGANPLTYTQNFDSMGAGTNNSTTPFTMPSEWVTTVAVGTAGNMYTTNGSSSSMPTPTGQSKLLNLGASGASDRALGIGFRGIGSYTGQIGFEIENTGVSAIASLKISYTGEQWRSQGNTNFNPDLVGPATLAFEYSTDATSLGTGTWNSVSSLDFTTPVVVVAGTSLDGNASANRQAFVDVVIPLSVSSGSSVWLRWTRVTTQVTAPGSSGNITEATNAAHVIGVDDLTVTAVVPEPASLAALGLGGLALVRRRR